MLKLGTQIGVEPETTKRRKKEEIGRMPNLRPQPLSGSMIIFPTIFPIFGKEEEHPQQRAEL